MRGQNEWPATIARLVFDQPPLSVAARVVLAELREADGKIVIKTALRELVARGAYTQTTEAPEDPLDRPFVLLGVLRKVPYQEPGSRARFAYELTEAGRELAPARSRRAVPRPFRADPAQFARLAARDRGKGGRPLFRARQAAHIYACGSSLRRSSERSAGEGASSSARASASRAPSGSPARRSSSARVACSRW